MYVYVYRERDRNELQLVCVCVCVNIKGESVKLTDAVVHTQQFDVLPIISLRRLGYV